MIFQQYRELRDIPNKSGFEFIGIDNNDNEIECVVNKNPAGCHSVYDNNGNPVFMKLKSWRKKWNTKLR